MPRIRMGLPGAAFYIFPLLYTQRWTYMRDLYRFPIYKMDEDEGGDDDDEDNFDEDWEDEDEE